MLIILTSKNLYLFTIGLDILKKITNTNNGHRKRK